MAKQVGSDALLIISTLGLFIASLIDAQPVWYFVIPAVAASTLVIGDFLTDCISFIKRRK